MDSLHFVSLSTGRRADMSTESSSMPRKVKHVEADTVFSWAIGIPKCKHKFMNFCKEKTSTCKCTPALHKILTNTGDKLPTQASAVSSAPVNKQTRKYQSTLSWCKSFSSEVQTQVKTVEDAVRPREESKDSEITENIIEKAESIDLGRLFAVVHVRGKQRKITAEDILIVEGHFYPNIGDQLRLEKVMMVGSKDFTLIGRPILSRNVVKVTATVVEKTLSHYRTKFRYRSKKRIRHFKLFRDPQTMLVINSIELNAQALKES